MKTVNEAVSFFHSLERFGIQPGLERIRALCALLGEPQNACRYAHVAGTNGKGTVCVELESILRAAGYKTGLYVSPYVVDFRERIQLNGEMIGEEALVRAAEKVEAAIGTLNARGVYPTEFEAVTAAAFLCFQEAECDIVVLETGLGGRFDATNIIKNPIVSVITSISLDHVKVLGDTLGEIAFEKCGIIKPGRYVVTPGTQETEALAVIRAQAQSKNAFLFEADAAALETLAADISGTTVKFRGLEMKIPFAGAHQLENAAAAVKAAEVIGVNGYDITPAHIKAGLEAAVNPARTEVLCAEPLILLDGSHNDGSTKALRGVLDAYLPGKRLIAVMGMMADKDAERAIGNLCGRFSFVYAVTPDNPRSMPAERFASMVRERGVPAEAVPDACKGVDLAIQALPEYDGLVVCGSLYLAAEVRRHLMNIISDLRI